MKNLQHHLKNKLVFLYKSSQQQPGVPSSLMAKTLYAVVSYYKVVKVFFGASKPGTIEAATIKGAS